MDDVYENDDSLVRLYKPKGVNEIYGYGSSASIGRVKTGIVLKAPEESWWGPEILSGERKRRVDRLKHCFRVEERILQELGDHPRITRYLGPSRDPDARGLLFEEASHGDLQRYLDDPKSRINHKLRLRWCRQAAEAICYIHAKGVIHSDLRPDNFLVDANLDLRLCDFGGSTFGELSGEALPDAGFFDPREPWITTIATDIFSLGSVMYTIVVGHWPHGSPGSYMFKSSEEKSSYEARVDRLFRSNIWPNVEGIEGGNVIVGCWRKEYKTARAVLSAYNALSL